MSCVGFWSVPGVAPRLHVKVWCPGHRSRVLRAAPRWGMMENYQRGHSRASPPILPSCTHGKQSVVPSTPQPITGVKFGAGGGGDRGCPAAARSRGHRGCPRDSGWGQRWGRRRAGRTAPRSSPRQDLSSKRLLRRTILVSESGSFSLPGSKHCWDNSLPSSPLSSQEPPWWLWFVARSRQTQHPQPRMDAHCPCHGRDGAGGTKSPGCSSSCPVELVGSSWSRHGPGIPTRLFFQAQHHRAPHPCSGALLAAQIRQQICELP